MQRRGFVRGGLSVLAGVCLAQMFGCEPVRPLRIATNLWPGYESLYVARKWRTLPAHVQLVELQNASQVLAVMRTGMVDAVAVTLDEAITLTARGVSLRVIGVFDASAGADALISRRISMLSELRGARIGVENNALGAYFLSRVLEHAQLVVSDVNVVRLEVSAHEDAFRQGDVDAVITFDPVRSRLIALGGKVVFDSTQLPGEIVDVFAVHAALLEDAAMRGTLARVLKAADGVVRSLTPGSPTFAEMAPRLSLAASQVEASVQGIKLCTLDDMAGLLAGPKPVLTRRAHMMAERMRLAGLLQGTPALGDLVDERVLREARAL